MKRIYKLKADVEKIKELYQQGYSAILIANMLNIGKSTVAWHLKRLGISRTKLEALKLASKLGRFGNRKGENSPRWKGGQRKPRNGYIFTYAPDHPRAIRTPYVQEHIIVWEKANNKAMPDGWVIHHLNGIKGDNRIENLEAMPKGKHHSKLIELALKRRIRELEQITYPA